MSKKGFEVRNTFDTLFCDVELLPSAEKTLESINFDDLAQVLRHDAKAVYVYATWTKNKTGCLKENESEQIQSTACVNRSKWQRVRLSDTKCGRS